MALSADDLKAQLGGVVEGDEDMLPRILAAAIAHIERVLGFKIDDPTEFPDGTPADLDQAVLMLAAHWYENREASLVGITAQPLPFGVEDIVREHRRYSFG